MTDPQPYLDQTAKARKALEDAYQQVALLVPMVPKRPSSTFQAQSLEMTQDAIVGAISTLGNAEAAHKSRHHLDPGSVSLPKPNPVPPIVEAARAAQCEMVGHFVGTQDPSCIRCGAKVENGIHTDPSEPTSPWRTDALAQEQDLVNAERKTRTNADAMHERTQRCLGDDHANCAHVEVMHQTGDHHWCLPVEDGARNVRCPGCIINGESHSVDCDREDDEPIGKRCVSCVDRYSATGGQTQVNDAEVISGGDSLCVPCYRQTDRAQVPDEPWVEVTAYDGVTHRRTGAWALAVLEVVRTDPDPGPMVMVHDGVTGEPYIGTAADRERENERYKADDQPEQRAAWLAEQRIAAMEERLTAVEKVAQRALGIANQTGAWLDTR